VAEQGISALLSASNVTLVARFVNSISSAHDEIIESFNNITRSEYKAGGISEKPPLIDLVGRCHNVKAREEVQLSLIDRPCAHINC